MRTSSEPTSIIVAEYGADACAWSRRFAVGTPSLMTIVQASDEGALEFAMRVRTVVNAFVDGGGLVARAVLVGGGQTGAEMLSARSLTIRALVSPMASMRQGSMLLDASGADRHSMMALATTVSGQVSGTGVTVTATSSRVAAA